MSAVRRQTCAEALSARRGQQVPRNLTIPATRNSPENAPVHGCKIGEGGRGALCDTAAQRGGRARERSLFSWRRPKSRAPERREHKERWPQGTRREVGRVSRKAQTHVFKGENANLQGQGEHTHPDKHDGATPLPKHPQQKTNRGEHIQHANPKG